jgi:hypothetical protein
VSSRRRQRRRSCTRKHRYPSAVLAAKAAATVQARAAATPLHAYPCQFCRGWHIGHHRPPDPADLQGACP